MEMPKIRWIRRCAQRILDQNPWLGADQAITMAADLWWDAEEWNSPEEAADTELAGWDDEDTVIPVQRTLH
ncbi:hypothetical protein [Eleftheria terrae]|uniref:hypothetical protein n=1 Tax=Eleftheria terrae TaxID=1597781 RepID=UPI00263B192F|nr:hypothetical protein [Eleftheria terrae]WKB52905.1 hypothetical protein N7L95_00440 [Eleftheria terrae]